MLGELLDYLSDPVFFTGFSLVIGVAYIYVWVTSLRDLSRQESSFYSLDQDAAAGNGVRQRPLLKYSGRRISVRSKAVRDEESESAGRRRARITRAA
ncbi:hypothetical protein LLH00_01960 [bacterium]|nr:hypothetical protein [bacterium]